MPVIARDTVASDHLVYAWPFPIGPEEYEVACADDEQVVMCPSWLVGDRLGPGRHRWRSPTPMQPAAAYFVLTAPVEVSFDMTTSFVLPTSGQSVRLRANGSLQVRCSDPGLLIAQFVGLPFDAVNDGIVRSVSKSVERMLARLLTRRVVMAGTPAAVTDPTMHANIVEELVAYNPAAGAVFGVELMRMGHMAILADDGSQPLAALQPNLEWSGNHRVGQNGDTARDKHLLETVRAPGGRNRELPPTVPPPLPTIPKRAASQPDVSGEIERPTPVSPHRVVPTPVPAAKRAASIEVPQSTDDITQPGVQLIRTPVPGSIRLESEPKEEARGSIIGIGMGHMGTAQHVASGEITKKMAPGARVLVPGPNGLMQSATVRQLLQGYYELEVGGSGETIWVPVNGVVPE